MYQPTHDYGYYILPSKPNLPILNRFTPKFKRTVKLSYNDLQIMFVFLMGCRIRFHVVRYEHVDSCGVCALHESTIIWRKVFSCKLCFCCDRNPQSQSICNKLLHAA